MNQPNQNNPNNQINIPNQNNQNQQEKPKKKKKKEKEIERDYKRYSICPKCHIHIYNLEQHTQWHKKKDELTRGISRNWYSDSATWVVTAVGTQSTIEKYIKEEEDRKPLNTSDMLIVNEENDNNNQMEEEMEIELKDNEEPKCVHCQDFFEFTADMKFKNCIRTKDGVLVHKDCLDDYLKTLN